MRSVAGCAFFHNLPSDAYTDCRAAGALPGCFCRGHAAGVAAAAIQQIMPANMRAQGSALYLFVINLIGLGLGPSAVAWCTDYVFQDPNKVNLSLMWVGTFFGLLSAVLLYFGSKHYRSTLNYLEAYSEKQMA